jgi:cbb3-type cytochrome c oxidase subunit III
MMGLIGQSGLGQGLLISISEALALAAGTPSISGSGLGKMIFCGALTIFTYLGTNSYPFLVMTAHMHNAFAGNAHSLIARATINVKTLLKVLAQLAMVLAACAVSSGVVHAADSPELERMAHQLAHTTCAYCHGVSGNSISPMFPNLSAQTAPYLQAQLRAFRDQSRADPDAQAYMWGMASQLSDATIDAISNYYAAQAASGTKYRDEKLLGRGKEIFEEGIASQGVPACATCHGSQARGNDIFPRLAGQHADYLVKQALVIQRDLRASPVMHDVIKNLSQDQMRAVATYLESLSP